MNNVEIYFFSGTGNSLVVANDLAKKLDGQLMPMIPQLKKATIETDAKVIGLVFPIYDFKAPRIVEGFIGKLANIESKYIFAVATYGFLPLKAMKRLAKTTRRILHKKDLYIRRVDSIIISFLLS